jgi:hypothetical protein
VATEIANDPTFARTAAVPAPLHVIAERRWFILGSMLGTILVWTQVTNLVAWIAFIAGITGMLGWIIYGTARTTRSRARAAGITAAWFGALLGAGAAATVAVSYATRSDTPAWIIGAVCVVVVAAALWASWQITAPLRNVPNQ